MPICRKPNSRATSSWRKRAAAPQIPKHSASTSSCSTTWRNAGKNSTRTYGGILTRPPAGWAKTHAGNIFPAMTTPQGQSRRRHSRSRTQKAPMPARICARHRGLVTSKNEHPPSRTHPLSYAARMGAATCFLRESTPGIQALSPSFKFTPNTSETNCVSPSQMNCEPSARMSVAKNSTNW